MSSLPRISLISPSYQQGAYLAECLNSVAEQNYPALEHIVMDGGSTDGSRALIEAHAEHLAYWQSERDKGQSDALAQGTARSTGQVFGWLNSDDVLLPGALHTVGKAFAADPALILFGGRIINRQGATDTPFEPVNDASDTERLFRDPVINQPATFYRMDVVRAVGGVDPALRYVMDVELWWRVLFRYGAEHMRFVPDHFARFRLHENSKTVSEHAGFLEELASLLNGMCMQSGNEDLVPVFAAGYQPKAGLRGVPVSPEQHAQVRGMAIHFLLKWHGKVHNERDFGIMKALAGIDRRGIDLVPALEARWQRIAQWPKNPTWFGFRVRRKLKGT